MNIQALLLLAGGFYLLTQGKKSSYSSTKKDTKPAEQPPVEKKYESPYPSFIYNCDSIQVIDKDQTTKDVIKITKDVIVELGINSSNFQNLDILKYTKAFISKINPSCIKSPLVMNYQEKVLYFLIGKIGIHYVDMIFAIPDYSPEKYPKVVPHGIECELIGEEDFKTVKDYGTCAYVIDHLNPDFEKWQEIKSSLLQSLAKYLGLEGKAADLKAAGEYLGAVGHYP